MYTKLFVMLAIVCMHAIVIFWFACQLITDALKFADSACIIVLSVMLLSQYAFWAEEIVEVGYIYA